MAILNWIFDPDNINETTIDDLLVSQEEEIHEDNGLDSPGAALWALKAIPSLWRSSPRYNAIAEPTHSPARPQVKNDSLHAQLLRKRARESMQNSENKENIVLPKGHRIREQLNFDTPSRQPRLNEIGSTIRLPGIIRTPGNESPKKAVVFADSVRSEQRLNRIRSGLPKNFPGKFPSPWTPKSVIDRLDLAETPPTTHALRRQIHLEHAVQKNKQFNTTKLTKSNLLSTSTTPSQQITRTESIKTKSKTRKLSQAEVKQVGYLLDTVLETNNQLESLVTEQAKQNSKLLQSSHVQLLKPTDPLLSFESSDWKQKYLQSKQENERLIKLLDDVQQHTESMTRFAEAQDKKVTALSKALAEQEKLRKLTEMDISQLRIELKNLKLKSEQVNRRRLRKLAGMI
ncbi:uncharacterized protein V1516DRAFT_662945 [Lipomyces oligophaga]|uniref:uncharacterized protein n=1 Tax=Lipomyces oligophaga TaxID=45792 RepID=UPI0034CE5548